MTDAHPYDPDAPENLEPMNLEAEQAVLGAVLFDNDAFLELDGVLAPRDFHEPFHQRLFKAMGEDIRAGRLADPNLLTSFFAVDPAFEALGGKRYLADLVDHAPPVSKALHYAAQIRAIALRREVIRICGEMSQRARIDASADGADLMADLERELLSVRAGKDDLALRTWAEVSREVVYGMERPASDSLLRFGIPKLDNIIGGCEGGELVVLSGRPGMGKSALGGCIALNLARDGVGVCEINAEMTTSQMARRHLCNLAFRAHGEDAPFYRDIKRGTLSAAQRAMLADVQGIHEQLPLRMVKRTGLTLGRIRAMLMRQRMVWQGLGVHLGLVVIDHVGLVRSDERFFSRQAEQADISLKLKEMADDLGCVILALAQLNREVEKRDDKRPQLSDLRDSGTWEQDADVVIGCYRDAYYARREPEPKKEIEKAEWHMRGASREVEAIALKVREGDVGTAKLWASIGHNAILNEQPPMEGGFL